ncbi:Alcohol dehydrogenase transcription factor Myb/SANT-like [Popillia japonica]|uniref:Alcohol dehydrogenase transcription factor Myb/SANT-like n=1 Tax=Popillia japonica TaxID=7064 RepID=A0AAW1LY73_POPJA
MNHVTLRQLHQLIFEIRKHPFLYDETHPDHKNKERHSITWDLLAAIVYKDIWDSLSNAVKGKKAKQLQSCVTPKDYEFLVEMDRCAKTLAQGTEMTTNAACSSQNNSIAGYMEPPSKNVEEKKTILVDREEALFLEYLLPEYNTLSSSNKREALYQCHCAIKKLREESVKVESEFPVNIKLELPTLKLKDEKCITVLDSDDEK